MMRGRALYQDKNYVYSKSSFSICSAIRCISFGFVYTKRYLAGCLMLDTGVSYNPIYIYISQIFLHDIEIKTHNIALFHF